MHIFKLNFVTFIKKKLKEQSQGWILIFFGGGEGQRRNKEIMISIAMISILDTSFSNCLFCDKLCITKIIIEFAGNDLCIDH